MHILRNFVYSKSVQSKIPISNRDVPEERGLGGGGGGGG